MSHIQHFRFVNNDRPSKLDTYKWIRISYRTVKVSWKVLFEGYRGRWFRVSYNYRPNNWRYLLLHLKRFADWIEKAVEHSMNVIKKHLTYSIITAFVHYLIFRFNIPLNEWIWSHGFELELLFQNMFCRIFGCDKR